MCESERQIIEQYKKKFEEMNRQVLIAKEEVQELKKLVKVGSSVKTYATEPTKEDLAPFLQARLKESSLEEVLQTCSELEGKKVDDYWKVNK